MTLLQQLLLLPLLAPLLAVLLLAAVNPRPPVALRVLIWTSPALPLGAWMAAAAASGAGLSALATGLALRQAGPALSVQRRRRPWTADPRPAAAAASSPAAAAPGRATAPSRSPGEPAPTVEVPFRVIRKAPAAAAAAAAAPTAAPTAARAVGDGWDQPLGSDWD
ncbi:MAG: hypothetical protein FJ051_01095 [Cyanobacteria bacterium M_surface_9_m1_291]|nr:hypothetical protein [Cyanobacteria bacterium M_surface_9_m1_291]